jgi:(1->4)-alpha-D-glucan 1-alpha-D-glucosylmutase
MDQSLFYNLRIPVATYRLQFNGNFRFTDAAAIVPYLAELGITDVYASPYLTAHPGSPHGYDITDPTRINPEIGTEEEYCAFTDALKQHGMGQILDIVPNHMCIDSGNRYWMDLLENGPASSFSGFFDIDWDPVKKELRKKVLLPLLGDQYGVALEKKDIQLTFEEGAFFLRVYGNKLPILPETYADILSLNIEDLEGPDKKSGSYDELMSIITSARRLPPYFEAGRETAGERYREKEIMKKRLNEICQRDPEMRAFVDRCIAAFNGQEGNSKSFDLLDNLLSRQVYRLSHWRVAAEEINYRRFFDINSLAAIRMEDPEVFE